MVTAGVLNRTLAFFVSLTLRMVASLPLYAATAPMLSDVPVDRAAAYTAVAFQPAVLADDAEVRGRDAARRAVGRGDGGADLHILNQRVFIIIARDAARLAVGGVDRILGMAAIADRAARVVHARNTARIFCAGAHRGTVLHTGDFGTVRTGHAARVVGGSDAAADRAVGVFSAANAACIYAVLRIDTGHAARTAGGGDTAIQRTAGQRDIADVGTGHAARVLVGLHRASAAVVPVQMLAAVSPPRLTPAMPPTQLSPRTAQSLTR